MNQRAIFVNISKQYRIAALLLLCTLTLPAVAMRDISAVSAGTSPSPDVTTEEPFLTGRFEPADLDAWKQRSFEGNTQYSIVEDDGVKVLRGYTQGQASVLYREQQIDLTKTPVMTWSWKVDRIFSGTDEKTRGGDDFPARLYVVVKTGAMPWNTLAINYVWASDATVGDDWANPFTDKARMVAVESGDSRVGQWTTHSRNIAEDFKTLFGRDTRIINGYAVMVDGDNAGQEATAWFRNIVFSAEPL